MPSEPEHKSNRQEHFNKSKLMILYILFFKKPTMEQPYQSLEKNPEFEYKGIKMPKGKKV